MSCDDISADQFLLLFSSFSMSTQIVDYTDRWLHHDYTDRYLLKHFIIGYIAVYIVDPINVSRLACDLINSFP